VRVAIQGTPILMHLTKDRTYVGTIKAPVKPGPYSLELSVDGKVLARSILTVVPQ
jgi:hypothetical protein